MYKCKLAALIFLAFSCGIFNPVPVTGLNEIIGNWIMADSTELPIDPTSHARLVKIDTSIFIITADSMKMMLRVNLATQSFPPRLWNGAVLKDSVYTDIERRQVFMVRYYEEPVRDSLFDVLYRIDEFQGETLLVMSEIRHDSLVYQHASVTRYNENAVVQKIYTLAKIH